MIFPAKLVLAAAIAIAPAATALGDTGAPWLRYGGAISERFNLLDADKDGVVTRSEVYGHRKSQFPDIDGDGAVSAAELDAEVQRRRLQRIERHLMLMDSDGNGRVDIEEYARAGTGLFRHMDKNRDGVISKDEATPSGKGSHAHQGCRH